MTSSLIIVISLFDYKVIIFIIYVYKNLIIKFLFFSNSRQCSYLCLNNITSNSLYFISFLNIKNISIQ